MAGFLSKMFEAEDDGSSEGQSNTTDVATDADTDIAVEVAVHTETGIEYQTEDGSGGYSTANDVGLTLSADALVATVTEVGFSDDTSSD